jgi:raffinose/stachyose/melibiose transport system substrate-binding protein
MRFAYLTRRRRDVIAAMACVTVASGLVAGAAAGSSSSSKAKASPNSAAPLATSGTVNWWGWTPTDETIANSYISAFNKVYPKIKVNYKLVSITNWPSVLRPALVSGTGPDVFDMQPGAYVTEFGSFAQNLAPLYQSALGSGWKSKIAPISVSGFSSSGKLTAMSVGSTYAGTLWINPALFKQYKVTPPATLAQWAADCKVFKAHGVGCFVQGDSQEGFDQDTLQSIANSVQPGLWTAVSKGKAKWDSPGIVKTLTIWKSLFTDGIMQSGALGYAQYPDANNAFLTKKFAMVMMGTWYMENVTQAGMTSAISAAGVAKPKTFPIESIPFPKVAGNSSAMYGDADYGLAVSTKSKDEGAADTFVKWLTTSTAGQQLVANSLEDIPSLKGVDPNFGKAKLVDRATQQTPIEKLIKQVGTVTQPREALLSADVQNDILAAAQSVASGSATPAAAAKKLQSSAGTIIP